MIKFAKTILASSAFLAVAAPTAAWACACGCGVFEVGPNMLVQMNAGPTLFVEYNFMDQNKNWSGTSSAPSSANDDKEIKTHFITFGGQYTLNGDWSVTAELPVWNRTFKTDPGSGVATFEHTAVGDVRLSVAYSGLFSDMSTSLIAGVKLPTGTISLTGLDRDTQIGTGSTDLLVGAVHAGDITIDGDWSWYGQILWDKPILKAGGYTPGSELDAAVGIVYGGFGMARTVQFKPFLQLIGSNRVKDSGPDSDRPNTGYTRLMLSPGLEVAVGNWRLFGDVEFPVYQDMNGDQLVAPEMFKFVASYSL